MRTNAGRTSQYTFNQVPTANIYRTRMRRTSTHTTTINSGLIYPLYYDEVLPGDTHKVTVSALARLTTLLVPIMDNIYLDWHFFFVPNRLVWSDWQRMNGEREYPDQSIDVSVPYVHFTDDVTDSSIFDYMGVPIGVTPADGDVMALPFRAYQLIWNEWFRNENIQASVNVSKSGTPDNDTAFTLLPRNKRKDYFTSMLPQPQKGPQLVIPLGGSAPVVGTGMSLGLTNGTDNLGLRFSDGGTYKALTGAANAYGETLPKSVSSPGTTFTGDDAIGVTKDGTKSGLIADLSNATASSINALRQAFQLQRLLEKDALGGTRYVEFLKAHFGVTSPDARLQRPEFLGSCTMPINVHAVTQTSASVESGTAQGNLAGVGVANGIQTVFTKSFVEHGMILGLASVRTESTYQYGLPRWFSRRTRYDFYLPVLAHLGQQGVLNKELYYSGDSATTNLDNEAAGYQERWAEYKYGYNRLSGKMRSNATGSLDVWHLAQEFSQLPTLNNDFIKENPPLARAMAVSEENAPSFLIESLFDVTSVRPMPLYCTPGYIDHF